MNRKFKKGTLLFAGAGLSCLLSACGDQLPDPPADYQLGGDSVVSITAALGEEAGGEMTAMETPETGASSSAAGGGPGAEQCYYTYEKLETGGATVEQYVASLLEGDSAFEIVDESGKAAPAPDYAREAGAVALARTAAEDGKILRLDLAWTATDCEITLTKPDGQLGRAEADPMTNTDAAAFLKSLGAQTLGLPGEMADYRVYPIEGAVTVDGFACLKLRVYRLQSGDGANEIMGTYLLSGDKANLYRLEDQTVTPIQLR